MSYRTALPQLEHQVFLTDGGLETDLRFNRGIDLPHFAACALLLTEEGRAALRDYFAGYAGLAVDSGVGLVLDTATWRANPDWIAKLGLEPSAVRDLNIAAVELAVDLREEFERPGSPMPINGVVGPRGDGYVPGELQSIDEARDYHSTQIGVFAGTEADLVSAITMNYVEEAAGIALAARDARIPSAISFTVETDGRLITGETLAQAIDAVDSATDSAPAYYMVNCCHPQHLPQDFAQLSRVRGFRANASAFSHAELDEAEELDAGDPAGLGQEFREARHRMPALTILGGCCGTDLRHLAAITEKALA